MKVAAIQMAAGPDKAENIAKAKDFVEQAISQGAEWIALPEVFNYRGALTAATLEAIKEGIPGPSTKPFQTLSQKHRVHILIGSLYEKIGNSSRVYNTSVLIDNRGAVKDIYRKIHLFDAVIGSTIVQEARTFKAGERLRLAGIKNFKIGLTICYDLRFPELYRQYAKQGANVFTVPSAFTKTTGQAHWEVLLRARAIENVCYVVAPNQIGRDVRGVESYGNSMVVSPWGEILARASGDKEEIIYSSLSIEVIKERKKVLPGVTARRIDG